MSPRDGIGLERYSDAFEALYRGAAADDPQWAQTLRRKAMSRFMELGLPTARRGNEDWKYTDVRPITRVPFQPVIGPQPVMPDDQALDRYVEDGLGWDRIVFVNGAYISSLSSLSSVPNGVLVTNLDAAIKSEPDLLESHLARYAGYETHAFTALNTAFAREGAFICVPDGTVVEKPIQILHLSAAGGHDMATNPRSLVLVGKGSVATVIESYASLTDDRYLTNGVTEIVLEPGAILNHYRVQCQSEEAYHIATAHVVLNRDSTFSSFTLDLGGKLARNNLHVLLDGEGSSCVLNGIYVATRSQHVDNQIFVDHAKPHTTSREMYKGILNGRSRAVFHGSIHVRQNAQKVDARQENRNLLLSDQAEADTKPAFWIYADDVKCSHGASCGKMDDGALFYLRSRGIDEEEAHRMLIQAFVNEVIDTIGNGSIRSHVGDLVTSGLRAI